LKGGGKKIYIVLSNQAMSMEYLVNLIITKT